MPRVIAGEAKGLRLKTPAGKGTRPTADRTKEALFSSIGAFLPEAKVLDLYAGSGQLGIEALSRGAAEAVFVEQSRKAAAAIAYNLEKAGFEERAGLLHLDVKKALNLLSSEGESFDLIFADPPYREAGQAVKMIEEAAASGLLKERGLLLFEAPSSEPFPEPANGGLILLQKKVYGAAELGFFCRKN